MGLGITARFPVGAGAGTGRGHYEEYFSRLRPVVPGWEPSCFFGETEFRVTLAPFEEAVYGEWVDGSLLLSAKTSSSGPGYHAYLTEVLEGLGVAPTELDDETGYWRHRDFGLLQAEMAQWLQGLSGQLVQIGEAGNHTNIAVSLAIECVPEHSDHFACCPLGYFDLDFFKKADAGQVDGAAFFVWWNQSQDALFFRNCAMNLIWCSNNWLTPFTDDEHSTVAATLGCLEKAYALDPSLSYPAAEWMELALLANNGSLEAQLQTRFGAVGEAGLQTRFDAVGEAGLGYRRGLVCSDINGWRMVHSGRMHFEYADDGSIGTSIWWDHDITIRASTITVKLKEGFQYDNEERLWAGISDKDGFQRFPLKTQQAAAAISHTQIDQEDEPYFQTQLRAASDSQVLILSISYTDQAFRELATKICASITR